MEDNDLKFQGIADMASFGQFGIRQLGASETSIEGESFYAVLALEPSVVVLQLGGRGDSEITLNLSPDTALSSFVGPINEIEVNSGSVVGYLRSRN